MKSTMFDSNSSVLSVCKEQVEGEVPVDGKALVLQVNSIDNFGNSVETTTRQPLSTSRDAKKGTITSLTSAVEITQDLTLSAFDEFFPTSILGSWRGATNMPFTGLSIEKLDGNKAKIYPYVANIPEGSTIIASGFKNEENNGEKTYNTVIGTLLGCTEPCVEELNTNGTIVVELPDVTNSSIKIMNYNYYIEYADTSKIPLGTIAELSGYSKPGNNGRAYVWKKEADKLYLEGLDFDGEDTTRPVDVEGKTFDIISKTLTGGTPETIDVTISASGTFNITIGDITAPASGSQTLKIYVDDIEVVNETHEFDTTKVWTGSHKFTKTQVAGQKKLTTVRLEGSGWSAENVVITYKEDKTTKPSEANLTLMYEYKNVSSVVAGDGGTTQSLYSLLPPPLMMDNALFMVSGYKNASNNGIKKVVASDASSLTIEGDVPFVTEVNYSEEAKMTFIGIEAPGDEIGLDEEGNLKTDIGSSVIIPNSFLSKVVELFFKGQAIWIGGLESKPETRFDDPYANGLARIVDISSDKIVLDKRNIPDEVKDPVTGKYIFTPDSPEVAKTKRIHIYIGKFARTYPVESDYFKRTTYTYELATLNDAGTRYYEYSYGNLVNSMEISLPSQANATMTVNNISRRSKDASTTPMNWKRIEPTKEEAVSTPTDMLRFRITNMDDSGLSTIWTDATISVGNNVGQEYALGQLEPVSVATGQFDVTLSGTAFFTNPAIFSKITNNCDVSADVMLVNGDGCIFIDIPTATLSDGARDFANNEKVKQSLTATAYANQNYGYSISATFFEYVPSEREDLCK